MSHHFLLTATNIVFWIKNSYELRHNFIINLNKSLCITITQKNSEAVPLEKNKLNKIYTNLFGKNLSQWNNIAWANMVNIPVKRIYRCILLLSWVYNYQNIEAVVKRCSAKKVFLEISQNSQENTCANASFLIKLQASGLDKKIRKFMKAIKIFLSNK